MVTTGGWGYYINPFDIVSEPPSVSLVRRRVFELSYVLSLCLVNSIFISQYKGCEKETCDYKY